MSILLIAVHVIVCLVLILVILLQAGRGQGLTGGGFGSGNVQSLLGTKASSFLTKATSVCAVLFLFTCIGLNVVEVQKSRSLFQAKGAASPLDVDQIRKALEKVKKSDAAVSAQKAAKAAVSTAAADTVKTAEKTAGETAKK
jgi:preprotein translocase subunit SecG